MEQLVLYASVRGSRWMSVIGVEGQDEPLKHFMAVDVRDTGLQTFRHVILFFFGIGTMLAALKQGATWHSEMDWLKMCEDTGKWRSVSVWLGKPHQVLGLSLD